MGGRFYTPGRGGGATERCVGALLARLVPRVPLLIRSGGSDERERERARESERERESKSWCTETPGERLTLTAQQRRNMPGGPQLFDKFKCNVWL